MRLTLVIAFFAASVLALACDDVKPSAPSKTCTKEYEQCMLPTGVLGVCSAVECAADQVAPCLVCRSQH
jgi:hypothetical protein